MSDETRLTPPVRGVLEQWGWDLEAPLPRAVVPAVLRGTGAVLAVPPAPAWAAPALAALFTRATAEAGLVLVLTPEAFLEAWPATAAPLAGAAGCALLTAPTAARATRLCADPGPGALITTPDLATELLRRSALPVERLRAVALAWPEVAPPDDALAELFAALPRELPRLVCTADPAGQADLIERHAWRAPVAGPLGSPATAAPALPRARVAECGWAGREAALAALVEAIDPAGLTVWTADRSAHEAIRTRLAAAGVTPAFATAADPVENRLVVAWDPPAPEALAALADRDLVLLLPPGTAGYAARWAGRLHPVGVAGPLAEARRAMAADRETVRARLEAGPDAAALATLAPLFERHPAQAVAAALHALWVEARRGAPAAPAPAATPPAAAGGQPRPRVWASAGRKDGASIGEWLALLTLELGIPRDHVTRVEVRDTFTLLECRSPAEAAAVVDRLAGRTFRDRRLSARLDRGPDRGDRAPRGRGRLDRRERGP